MNDMAHETPRQLAARAVAASWLVFATVPLVVLLYHILHPHERVTVTPHPLSLLGRLLLFLTPLILGAALVYAAELKLKRGIRSKRWPTDQLAEAREALDRPAYRLANYSGAFAAVAWALGFFVPPHSPFRVAGALAYALATPAFALTRLKQALDPSQTAPMEPIWSDAQPLHSTQWGKQS